MFVLRLKIIKYRLQDVLFVKTYNYVVMDIVLKTFFLVALMESIIILR